MLIFSGGRPARLPACLFEQLVHKSGAEILLHAAQLDAGAAHGEEDDGAGDLSAERLGAHPFCAVAPIRHAFRVPQYLICGGRPVDPPQIGTRLGHTACAFTFLRSVQLVVTVIRSHAHRDSSQLES
jgi:hypothetical protein